MTLSLVARQATVTRHVAKVYAMTCRPYTYTAEDAAHMQSCRQQHRIGVLGDGRQHHEALHVDADIMDTLRRLRSTSS